LDNTAFCIYYFLINIAHTNINNDKHTNHTQNLPPLISTMC